MARFAWGIDIGDGTLKAVRLKAKGRVLQVVDALEIPYLDPFLKKKSPPATLDRRAIAALYQFGNTVRIHESDEVALGFHSFLAIDGTIDLPDVEDGKLESLTHYEISNRTDTPLNDLAIRFHRKRSASPAMVSVQVHAVKKKELDGFLHYVRKSGILYDRVVSGAGALVEMAGLCLSTRNDLVLVSPGFNATLLVLSRKDGYQARFLPKGLPAAPGDRIVMAKDQAMELCEVLKGEIDNFVRHVIPDRSFAPQKILVSGEGARVPTFINALDALFPEPVELLRPGARLEIALQDEKGLSPETILSMGKAIGLAKGILDASADAPSLSPPPPERKVLKKLPQLLRVAVLVLVMALGMAALEWRRGASLFEQEQAIEGLAPLRAEEMGTLMAEDGRMKTKLARLVGVWKSRESVPRIGELLSRFERNAPESSPGDYHLVELEIDFTGRGRLQAFVGTRISNEDQVRSALASLFLFDEEELPNLGGPFPAKEETPPEGMAPLVLYKIEGGI